MAGPSSTVDRAAFGTLRTQSAARSLSRFVARLRSRPARPVLLLAGAPWPILPPVQSPPRFSDRRPSAGPSTTAGRPRRTPRRRLRPAVEGVRARARACLLHLRQAALRPLADGLQQGLQGPHKRGQRVLHFGRDNRVDLPLDEAVRLQLPQGL